MKPAGLLGMGLPCRMGIGELCSQGWMRLSARIAPDTQSIRLRISYRYNRLGSPSIRLRHCSAPDDLRGRGTRL
jgi:hypothetical protein